MKKKLLILALLVLIMGALLVVGASAYEMGDANLDGNVNTRDAVLIKQYVAEMVDLTDEQKYYADVVDDGTGKINMRDAVLILQHVAEMDVLLDTRPTIAFETNGGTAVAPIKEKSGTAITAPAAPSKTGYTFAGWYADKACTDAYTFTTMPATDMTLYAKWSANSYTITFESNGGSAVAPITQNYNTTVTAPTAPAKTGCTFGGWYTDAALTKVFFFNTMPAENVTLYAKWNQLEGYTVTFCDHDGTVIKEIIVPIGGSVAAEDIPDAPEHDGYRFDGWQGSYENVTASVFIKANCRETVRIQFVDHDNSLLYEEYIFRGENFENIPTDPTREDYEFSGWSVTSFENVSENLTVYAEYVRLYTVVFLDWDMSLLKEITVKDGEAFPTSDIPELSREGYTPNGWGELPATVTEDLTLVAKYQINKYTVTFLDGDGKALKTESVKHGFSVTPPEVDEIYFDWDQKKGFRFTGWSTSYKNVTENITVEALYQEEIAEPIVVVHNRTIDKNTVNTPVIDAPVVVYVCTSNRLHGVSLDIQFDNVLQLGGVIGVHPHSSLGGEGKDYTSKLTDEGRYELRWTDNKGVDTAPNEGLFPILTFNFKLDEQQRVGEYAVNVLESTYIISDDLAKVTPIVISGQVILTK